MILRIFILTIVLYNQRCDLATTDDSVEEVRVTTGSTAFLPCFMDMSVRRFSMHWFDNSWRPLAIDTRVVSDDKNIHVRSHYLGESHLIISTVTSDDAGEYRCVMKTSSGAVPSSGSVIKTVTLMVDEPSGPDCRDKDGQTVSEGDFSIPYSYDPCFECECSHGSQQNCRDVSCVPPPCNVLSFSTEACCDYTCEREHPKIICSSGMTNDESVLEMKCNMIRGYPEPNTTWYKDDQVLLNARGELLAVDLTQETSEGTYKCVVDNGVEPAATETFVVGMLAVQQVGSRHALIHVSMPDSYEDALKEAPRLMVHYENEETGFSGEIDVNEDMYALLTDQPANNVFKFQLHGLGRSSKPVYVRKALIQLVPRGPGLHISDAIGDVIEVPAGLHSTGRKLSKQLVLNFSSFFAIEVSVFKGNQCPSQECGMLTIYSPGYAMDGASTIFSDKRDLIWAKMHL